MRAGRIASDADERDQQTRERVPTQPDDVHRLSDARAEQSLGLGETLDASIHAARARRSIDWRARSVYARQTRSRGTPYRARRRERKNTDAASESSAKTNDPFVPELVEQPELSPLPPIALAPT